MACRSLLQDRATLFIRELFAVAALRLAPRGLLTLRLLGATNLWTPPLARCAASIHRALAAVFSDVLVLPGNTLLFLASQQPLERDPDTLGARLSGRGLETKLVSPAYVRWLYESDRFAELERLLGATVAPTNTDAHPVCYQYTFILWLAELFPVVALLDLSGGVETGLWILAAAIVLGLVASRFRLPSRRVALAFVAGLVGMILETVLILHYQVGRGVLFQDIGLLNPRPRATSPRWRQGI